MGLFDFLQQPNINDGVRACRNTDGAVLLDVRTAEEFTAGHIPGAVNIPLQNLSPVRQLVPKAGTPLYVYCRSGSRSRQAVGLLRGMGYSRACNIGGILGYRGEITAEK